MKKANQIITAIRVAVYLIAIVGIGTWAWKNFAKPTAPKSENAKSPTSETYVNNSSGHVVLVTYFTSNVRCKTCLTIEKLTREAINEEFAPELASKEIVFQTINYDEPENKHYTKDYGLAFKTVVVSERKKGKEVRWAKYDDVWKLHSTPAAFKTYLQTGIRQHLTPSP